MRRAAIILVPSAWGNPGEFKMSRLAPILANARCVLLLFWATHTHTHTRTHTRTHTHTTAPTHPHRHTDTDTDTQRHTHTHTRLRRCVGCLTPRRDSSAHRFALVEDTAVAEDIAPFRDGLAVLPANEMALAAKHYLAHPELRREVAERGQRLFAGQAAADVLRPCVRSLLEAAGCSGVAAGDGW